MSGGTIFPSEYCPGGHVKGGTSHTVTTVYGGLILVARVHTNFFHMCPSQASRGGATDQCARTFNHILIVSVHAADPAGTVGRGEPG